MGGFQQFERRLEQMVSGVFAKAFRSAVQPVEISAALQRECDNNAQIISRDRRMVPNDFHVELSDTDLDRLAPDQTGLADELASQVRAHVEKQGYALPGPVRIAFEPADDLTTGRFRVRSRSQAEVTANVHQSQVRRARAALEINGTRHPLQPPGLVVGRSTEADLRINDPGISRRHVEFACWDDGPKLHVEVRDLGSTNGILVDGHRVTATALHHGSQVRAGNTTITLLVTEEDAGV